MPSRTLLEWLHQSMPCEHHRQPPHDTYHVLKSYRNDQPSSRPAFFGNSALRVPLVDGENGTPPLRSGMMGMRFFQRSMSTVRHGLIMRPPPPPSPPAGHPASRPCLPSLTMKPLSTIRDGFSVGSPLPPYMATAPRQHVRPYVHAINSSHNATLYEWCTSVWGEPTRYTRS